MCCVYRINSVSSLLGCYTICTLAKSRDGAGLGSGTGPGPPTSFPFQDQQGKNTISVGGSTYQFDKIAHDGQRFFWRCIDPVRTVRVETVRIKGNPTPKLGAYSRPQTRGTHRPISRGKHEECSEGNYKIHP